MIKRPLGVWLICGYIAFTYVSSLVSISYAFLSTNPDVEWGRGYYQSLSRWQLGYLVLNAAVAVSAATTLFLLRRISAWLFSGVLMLGILNVVWQVSSGWLGREATAMVGAPAVVISLVVGFVLMVAIVAYVWRLRMKGVLA